MKASKKIEDPIIKELTKSYWMEGFYIGLAVAILSIGIITTIILYQLLINP
jgi:hypothetical protein